MKGGSFDVAFRDFKARSLSAVKGSWFGRVRCAALGPLLQALEAWRWSRRGLPLLAPRSRCGLGATRHGPPQPRSLFQVLFRLKKAYNDMFIMCSNFRLFRISVGSFSSTSSNGNRYLYPMGPMVPMGPTMGPHGPPMGPMGPKIIIKKDISF